MDRILEQWARERPDLDVFPMGVIGRTSRLSRLFEQSLQDVFDAHEMGRGEFDVLATLRRAGTPYRLNPSELATTLMVSSGGMTLRLDRLERAGLIVRQPDPADRRGTLVQLTEEGLRRVDAALTEHVDNERQLLKTLEPHEQVQLAGLLRKLLISLEPQAGRASLRRPS